MGKVQEVKDRIRQFNNDAVTSAVAQVVLVHYPDANVMQMGYNGSYSDTLVGNRFLDYQGNTITDDMIKDPEIYFKKDTERAFGTVEFESKKNITYQIYTQDGQIWHCDITDSEGNVDNINFPDILDVIDYIGRIKRGDKK
jgi:hypothetical protein